MRKAVSFVRNLAPTAILFPLIAIFASADPPLLTPDPDVHTQQYAERFTHTADTVLAPVYAPLAAYLVERFDLRDREGLGIDLGSGPGHLIIELCHRTDRIHWVNADINPHFFPSFFQRVEASGCRDRVSAVFADAQALPFRSDYADIIVSRGSYPFWADKQLAFSEIHRTLKPNGVAFIGRGFPPNLPPEVAREVRSRQKGGPRYDPNEAEQELHSIMAALGIDSYQIHRPKPKGSEGINYGLWVEFHKGGAARTAAERTEPEPSAGIYRMAPVQVRGKQRDLLEHPTLESAGLQIATTVVTEQQIEKQGAETVIDALQYVPGSWTESRGRKVKQFLSVRGQRYPYPDYALNGAWQREFHEMPFFFSAADLDRIEVIRSSAALLSGLSGMAGVINLIPKRYDEPETLAEMEYGTFDSYRFHGSHGATIDEFSYALGWSTRHTDGPEDRQAAEAMSNFRGSLYWEPHATLSVQTHLFHLNGQRELARAEPPAAKRFQQGFEEFDPLQATFANLRTHHRTHERLASEFSFHYADRDHIFVSEGDTGHESTREHDYEWGMSLIESLALSRDNTLRIGGLYNHWIAPNGKRFYAGRRTDLETVSAVLVDTHAWGPFTVDGGFRLNKTHINEYGAFNIDGSPRAFRQVAPIEDAWEPAVLNTNLGVAWNVAPHLSLNANAASGIVEPRTGTLDVDFQEPEREQRVKLDLGVHTRWPSVGELQLVGFLTRQSDAIVLSGKTAERNGRVMELYLNRDQDQLALELDVRSVPILGIAECFLNATWMRSRAESEGEMTRNREIPQFILGGGVYAAKSRFALNLFWKHVSSYESTRFVASPQGQPPTPQPLGDFLSWDATASVALDQELHTRIYLEIQNITDQEFATVVGYPDYGRRATLGLRHTFE